MSRSSEPEHHRALRESLGAHLLGHLDEDADAMLRTHLDRCRPCRAELAELAPLTALLAQVDPDALDPDTFGAAPAPTPTPPPELGARIIGRVRAERGRSPRPPGEPDRAPDEQADSAKSFEES